MSASLNGKVALVTGGGRHLRGAGGRGCDLEGHVQRSPLKRLSTPQDIGRSVVALATLLTAVTGVILPVDAGRSLG